MFQSSLLAASLLLASTAFARDIPSNVQNLYNSIKASGECKNKLAKGFYSSDGGPGSWSYCGDHLDSEKIIYIQGTGGKFANMDIDCDGAQGGPADDGRCGASTDTQSQTSFMDTVAGYHKGIKDLNANIHPYVVFGNSGTKSGYANFNPQKYGIKPLSLMAVVCGKNLIYGVWGDENGDDGEHPMVGEASISLATACFGKTVNGNSGHDGNDVLYIGFNGTDAVPGASGANWGAKNYDDFAKSIQSLGDKLIQRIGTGGTAPSKTSSSPGSQPTCSWKGHCAGASCESENDCSDDLICRSGICA